MEQATGGPLIQGGGTAEAVWRSSLRLRDVPVVKLEQLMQGRQRLKVIAPHPDDEVLGTGGLMAAAANAGFSIETIAVTDGEASHPRQHPAALAERRTCECRAALDMLALASIAVHRLGVPDGGVRQHRLELLKRIAPLLCAHDLVLTPWRADGHPDHESSTDAVLALGVEIGFAVLEYPVWGWHWAEPSQMPLERAMKFELSVSNQQKKSAAIAQFKSQMEDQDDGPVLTTAILERFQRPFEIYLL